MKRLLILGAGTAGTMVANRLNRLLDRDEWQITIVDQDEKHY
jgi:sulfide:quinone oxidoreductase